jgi:hypothetical protein
VYGGRCSYCPFHSIRVEIIWKTFTGMIQTFPTKKENSPVAALLA